MTSDTRNYVAGLLTGISLCAAIAFCVTAILHIPNPSSTNELPQRVISRPTIPPMHVPDRFRRPHTHHLYDI